MKKYLIVFVSIISNFLFAQQKIDVRMEKVTIDSNLVNDFFNLDKTSKIRFASKTIVTKESTGKKDSLTQFPKDIDIIDNANIVAIIGKHFEFDNCAAHFKDDTLVIQFQNNSSFLPNPLFLDEMFIYTTKGKFYSEYITVRSAYWVSPYSLILKSQELTIKKLITKKGDRLMGNLTIQYMDQNPKTKSKLLTLTGPFDCIVQ